jgi:predicted RNA-binding protein YlxR (DUF448 family)
MVKASSSPRARKSADVSLPPRQGAGEGCLKREAEPESGRTCLVTGAVKAKDALIRFVLDPENVVVPDLAERLPGRGLWVSATRAALELAVKKNPFSRAAKIKAIVKPDMPQRVEALLTKRCLDLLGLARGAGLVVTGQAQVEQTLKNKELAYILVAVDAGGDGLKKLGYADIPLLRALTREELGAALGHDHLVYLGLRPQTLTEKLKNELMRWQGVATSAIKKSEKELESI